MNKRERLSAGIILVFLLAAVLFCVAHGQEVVNVESDVQIVGGMRLHHDALFYGQLGVIVNNMDMIAGIGFNNAVWIGVHRYIYANEELSAFSGVEAHILYPAGEPITFRPAIPVGFAVATEIGTMILEAVILPAVQGHPVEVGFAVCYLFPLWSSP